MQFVIHADHPCIAGHFPGCPIVPGVVVLNQVLQVINLKGAQRGPLTLSQVKFFTPLRPGQLARIDCEQTGKRWRFRVWNDRLIARGTVTMGPAE